MFSMDTLTGSRIPSADRRIAGFIGDARKDGAALAGRLPGRLPGLTRSSCARTFLNCASRSRSRSARSRSRAACAASHCASCSARRLPSSSSCSRALSASSSATMSRSCGVCADLGRWYRSSSKLRSRSNWRDDRSDPRSRSRSMSAAAPGPRGGDGGGECTTRGARPAAPGTCPSRPGTSPKLSWRLWSTDAGGEWTTLGCPPWGLGGDADCGMACVSSFISSGGAETSGEEASGSMGMGGGGGGSKSSSPSSSTRSNRPPSKSSRGMPGSGSVPVRGLGGAGGEFITRPPPLGPLGFINTTSPVTSEA